MDASANKMNVREGEERWGTKDGKVCLERQSSGKLYSCMRTLHAAQAAHHCKFKVTASLHLLTLYETS